MYFHTDASEVTSASGDMVAGQNEINLSPGGIVGFSLTYAQEIGRAWGRGRVLWYWDVSGVTGAL